jgi:hypothetical protein
MASAGSLSGFVAPSSTSGPIARPAQFGAGPSFVNAPSPTFANTSMPGIINIQSAITIRLNNENYLFWRAQVAPLLRSQMLMGYCDGSIPCPPEHVGVMHTSVLIPQPNPAYQHWIQQDQSILSAFVSSMTEGVLGMVMFANSSREAWETLNGAFASTSIARSSGIRQQMAELKKHDQTINVYFHRMKALADSLASIGEPLRDAEFISYLLAGLDKDYDALYQVVNARQGAMPIRDLYSLLQATEVRNSARYAAEASAHSSPAAHATAYGAPAAYAAHGGGTRPPPPRAAYVPPYARPPTPGYAPAPAYAPQPRPPPPPSGGKGKNACGGRDVQCQLCGIHGHPASRCYKRFNKDFLGLNNNGSGTEKQLAMAMMAAPPPGPTAPPPGYAPGYTYMPPAPASAYASAPAGVSAAPSHVVDPAWYADSGATHHITHELDKLTMSQPYYGADQVHAANGTGMRIHNIGHASISTPSSRSLTLDRVLHVPDATRNLLSMSKLALDNNVFIEVHPYDLFVKDRTRGSLSLEVVSLVVSMRLKPLLSSRRSAVSRCHEICGIVA